jgi:4-carboxymuconolactone decarboxylase
MDDATGVLVDASLALGLGDAEMLERSLHAASACAEPAAVEEMLLQSYLFLGYPAALRGLGVWRRVSGLPAPAAVYREDAAAWTQRGAATCALVYGGQYDRLRQNISALHPDMERWMVVEGYGKVLGRPGLDLPTRELCIIAVLSAQDAAPQLYSHLRGALNAGATRAEVDEVVQRLLQALAGRRADVLKEQWDAVRTRRAAPTGE